MFIFVQQYDFTNYLNYTILFLICKDNFEKLSASLVN